MKRTPEGYGRPLTGDAGGGRVIEWTANLIAAQARLCVAHGKPDEGDRSWVKK